MRPNLLIQIPVDQLNGYVLQRKVKEEESYVSLCPEEVAVG
jgi:hypothetical protein